MEILPERPDPMPDLLSAWSEGAWRVALLPGSRQSEIRGHTPAMLACAAAIQRRWPAARCTFAAHDEAAAAEIRRHVGDADVELSIDKTHQVLATSHFALAASGTVTLEVAHFGVPMVIFYRTSRLLGLLHAAVGKNPRLVGTPHMSLVNILAGHRLVPELIPWNGRIARLREMVMEVMQDPGYLVEVRRGLIEAAASLHIEHGTASENAAELIVRRIEKR
jgi:lipid-A-disaccharide synthase